MKPFVCLLVLVIGFEGVTSICAWAGPPGSGIAALRCRREIRRAVLGKTAYNPPPVVRKAPSVCYDDSYVTIERVETRATSFTSDQPKLELVASGENEHLYFDLTHETYWLIGAQYVKSVTTEQASDYLKKNPVVMADSENYPQPKKRAEPVNEENEDEDWAAPLADSTSPGDMALKAIADAVPATIKVEDPTGEPGWADYDGDGSIDEVFPKMKSVVNPELLRLIEQLEKIEARQAAAAE